MTARRMSRGPLARAGGDVRNRRMRAVFATCAVVVALVSVNIATHWTGGALWFGPVVAVALVAFARRTGLSWSQLGLGADRLRSGTLWGLGAITVVASIYLVGVLVPMTRLAFLDARYHLDAPGAMRSALIVIPLGTVLIEEIAFRSVLWGMLARHSTTSWVLVVTSVLFGLWHILPSLHLASANRAVGDAVGGVGTAATILVVVATVIFTGVGGLVAGELRRRSGSVLASVGMHWATNALGVLFGLIAWRLAA